MKTMHLMIKVLKPFGFYIEEHKVGEEFSVPLGSVEELIKDGLATIVVNNMGNNVPYDEEYTEPWMDIPEEIAAPVPEEEDPILTVNRVRSKLGKAPLEIVVKESPKRRVGEPFWNRNGMCEDCGGNVDYFGPLNKMACDTCENEIEGWM
jgi:hypothetical protein